MNLTRVDVGSFIESSNGNAAVVKGPFDFYHYNCDGVNDEVSVYSNEGFKFE